eukprot:TRINITY_DN22757_c0_g1_i3.p1 TRINITY_DN22757_c0_g1~~TRINITY_DN22757_c0_g1_i3.p1  ORF type:complete len:135 (-),score=22.57 TRINITY_DN22757_c0_g1_i3:87-491(-)
MYVFSSEYGDGGVLEVTEEHVEPNLDDEGEERMCYGSSDCCLHGISVGGKVVVQFVAKLHETWSEVQANLEEMTPREEGALPPYFLEEWKPMVARLDVDTFRRIAHIPPEVTDSSLCKWLQLLSPWSWNISEAY